MSAARRGFPPHWACGPGIVLGKFQEDDSLNLLVANDLLPNFFGSLEPDPLGARFLSWPKGDLPAAWQWTPTVESRHAWAWPRTMPTAMAGSTCS